MLQSLVPRAPKLEPEGSAGRRRFRLCSVFPDRPEGLSEKPSPSRTLAVAPLSRRSSERALLTRESSELALPTRRSSELRAALSGSSWGAARTRRSGCCSLLGAMAQSGRRPGPKTVLASKWNRQPLAGSSLGPKTSFAANKSRRPRHTSGSVRRPRSPRSNAAGLVPRMVGSEDLSFTGSRAVDLVRRLPRPEDQENAAAGSIASAGSRIGPEGPLLSGWSRRSIPLNQGLACDTRWNMSTRVPSGVGRWAPLRVFFQTLENGPSLALQSRLQRLGDTPCSPRPVPPRWFQVWLAASLELLEPPSVSSTSGPRPASLPSLRSGRSLHGALSESPIPRGFPFPRYSARRTRALHSDPRVRALNSGGPGFSPVARLSCRVVLRSCFRPGTRLGLPRLPPRATFRPIRDRGSDGPIRVRRPSPCGCPLVPSDSTHPEGLAEVFRPGGLALPRPF